MDRFEKNLAKYIGAKHVLGVANATDAIYMLCRASGLGLGDKVIFCTHTMVATAAGIHFTGATPVPVETGWDHQIDPKSIEKAITATHQSHHAYPTKCRYADMNALQEIAPKTRTFHY